MCSWYKYLIVNLVFSQLGFWSGNLFLIVPFPDVCLLVPFYLVLFYAEFGSNCTDHCLLLSFLSSIAHFSEKEIICLQLSRCMGKPTLCIGEKKGAVQLCSNCRDSTISLLFKIQNFQPLTIFCDCTARFVSDLFETQIVGVLTQRLSFVLITCSLSHYSETSEAEVNDSTESRRSPKDGTSLGRLGYDQSHKKRSSQNGRLLR